ncbi:MAG: type ISP restriction/modification enzyme [Syntrophales bacterium]|nr:type ISP restriction/modification enzyme [Syntrophales bacterium]
MLKSYLEKIFKIADQGDAREESYYSTLEALLEKAALSFDKRKFHITTLPKTTEAGNPDFRIWDGRQHIVGYIEAKAPTIENLDAIEDTEQLQRYRNTFPNLILTNFFEFRLYRNGILVNKASIARPFIVHKLKTVPRVEKEPDFLKLVEEFYSFSLPKVYSAKNLAIELAKRTSFLKDEVIAEELAEEEKTGEGFILGFYEAFRQFLISGLSKEEFADLYSQTITYGLFAARMRSKNGFNRKLAYDNIPQTIGILRDVFRFISLEDVPAQMEWIIDDIAEVLFVADVNKLLQDYFREGKGKDPVIHFYETFLAEYDPKTRERRGVYYTPEPVVFYIVRSLHHILKDKFGRVDGMASDTVTVLDPASGTLTFLAEAAKLAVNEFTSKYGQGDKEGFIREHILKNFYAFELMMAPYAVGHLKMSFLLEELGCKLKKDDRFKLYLTNTLEMDELEQTSLPGMASLCEESHLAGKVKKEQPVLVIMGNPPYSGHSANKGEWIDQLLKKGYTHKNGIKDEGYYRIDGDPLGEKNPKWLQDDYVKFIRFSQWKIDQAGEGVLGFITNHGYLDNPTFRGMRRSLMNSFDEIYLLDLHGNSLKKEKCPDGSKDENVFDIRQGTAIALFIKKKGGNKDTKIFHSELWGRREEKYDWLLSNDVVTTKWQKIAPKPESYLFVPRDERLLEQYEGFPKITEIFPLNGVGMTTARDHLVIDGDKNRLINRIRLFKNSKYSDDELHEFFQIRKKKGWDIRKAWTMLQDVSDSDLNDLVVPVLYRPFDVKWIFYHDSVVWRTVKRVMRHMMRENLGLISARSNKSNDMNHFFCTNLLMETKCGESTTQSCIFPLYLYPDHNQKDLFSHLEESKERTPNINDQIFSALCEAYTKRPSPENIFHYIYAVFYSDTYRIKYAEFLKTDFPRVPFTKDERLFRELAVYGRCLADLHLMRSPELDTPIARFQGSGDGRVEKIGYDKETKRVYINQDQYFEGLEEDVWQYRIGGYQVCDKWLKDRKGKRLSLDDVKHYCKVATAIKHTITLQKDIDEIYSEAEKQLVMFGK